MGPIIVVIVVSNVKDKYQRTKLTNEIRKIRQKKRVEISQYIFHLVDIQIKLNVRKFCTETKGDMGMFYNVRFRLSDLGIEINSA